MAHSIPLARIYELVGRHFVERQLLRQVVPAAVNSLLYEGRLPDPPDGISRQRWAALVKCAAREGYPRPRRSV